MAEHNNEPELVAMPESYVGDQNLIELDPENELKFVESKRVVVCVHIF